eukprot:g4116.t1
MEDEKRQSDKNVVAHGDVEAQPTAAAITTNGMDAEADASISKTPTDGQEGNDDDDTNNTLWEQMTAREGRDAARRAGMSVGDWQAERQLQEALRESVQETRPNGGAAAPSSADGGGEESSFIDAGFHALGTNAVEGEEAREEGSPAHRPVAGGQPQPSPNGINGTPNASSNGNSRSSGHNRSAMMYSADGMAAAAAAEATASSGRRNGEVSLGIEGGSRAARQQGGEEEDEDEEDFGEVELVVTQDGGVIPVPAAAAATATAVGAAPSTGAAESLELKAAPVIKTVGRDARKDGVRGMARGEKDSTATAAAAATAAPAAGNSWKGATGRAGGGEEGEERADGQDGEEEEEEEEEEAAPPPDIMLTLADDVLHRVMLFLNPEDIFECRAVNSRWEFPSHEAVFEGLCRRTYLAQSAKKLLNVERWRSWQRMFKFRPRLRDTGLYSLKTTYFKKPVRDMSTEWTPGKILKVTYYRYFRFFGDGRVAYGLVHESPKEFIRMLQEGSPKVVYGTYTIRKWEVNVEIPNPWSWVSFTLQLANGERGRFTHLVMLRHSSVPRNDTRVGRCHHTVKSTDFFTFRRVWQF